MEKSLFLPHPAGRQRSIRWRASASIALVLAAWLLWQSALQDWGLPKSIAIEGKEPKGWANIQSSPSLDYKPCFDGYECARLDVPLDWKASEQEQAKKRAAIAIVKLPAKVPVTDPRYGGAILINPGGPGGSGVGAVLSYGKLVQIQADAASHPCASPKTSGDKFFDVIGFDPRGINNTTPHGSCFPDDASREIWRVQKTAQGVITNHSYSHVWGRLRGLSTSCTARMDSDEEDHVGRYINTPVVVEDMVAIVEALGQWREKQACLLSRHVHAQERQVIHERTKWRKGQEKILYWGFSYGTILGASFASMHPDRLHRFVVDGVADAEDYYQGLWSTNLQDTNKIMANFFTECYASGPEKCALANFQDAEEVFSSVLSGLQDTPLSVSAAGNFGPDLITFSDATEFIVQALYKPRHNFPLLARLVSAIHTGNGTEAAALKQESQFGIGCRSESCTRNPWSTQCHDPGKGVPEQGQGILCTDAGAWLSNTTADFHWEKYQMLHAQSPFLARTWAEITMGCAGWRIRPSWEHTPSLKGETSHPILCLGNTRDPVTPLRNAFKMSKGFPGSRVLTLDADGHCTISAPSLCVAKNVRRYFQTGELPEEGEVCQPNSGAFDGWSPDLDAAYQPSTAENAEDLRLFAAVQQMHDVTAKRSSGPLGI